jgi:Fic family protein
MNREQISQLTIKVYKLTILFPKKEPLRYRLRELAGNILANITTWSLLNIENLPVGGEKSEILSPEQKRELVFNIQRDLEVVQSYLELAKWQNWVSYFDILNIMEEYAKIIEKSRDLSARIEKEDISKRKLVKLSDLLEKKEQLIGEIEEKTEIADYPQIDKDQDLTERESKILEFLKEKGRVQVWEVSKLFPEVSKRTIRRDFVELLNSGLIQRVGEKNNTFYQI